MASASPNFSNAAKVATEPAVGAPDIYELRYAAPSLQLLNNLRDAERVQPFSGLDDVYNRMSHEHRTIYAWRDHNDPHNNALISVQVAFTQGKPNNIQTIIRAEDIVTDKPDTATFYTISNWGAHKGLGGPFLKAVVSDIQEKHPHIANFTTLSPIPGLRDWVANLTDDAVIEFGLPRLLHTPVTSLQQQVLNVTSIDVLMQNAILYSDLQKLTAFYLVGGTIKNDRFASHDLVANFHLNNGAEVGRLCPAADMSQKGFAQSFGFMSNYVYNVEVLAANAEAHRQGNPTYSTEINNLLSVSAVTLKGPEERPAVA